MQAFRRLIFHRSTKRLALDVVCEQRTEEHRYATGDCDQNENRDGCGENAKFPSQDGD
jgi:hypothetical protein